MVQCSNARRIKIFNKIMEGYLLCCFGKELYFQLCVRCIKNIRMFDPLRNICILTDNPEKLMKWLTFENNYTVVLFDYKNHVHPEIDSTNEWNKYGFIPKIFQCFYSPFEKTMFIDVDTIFKKDFTFIWNLTETILCSGFSDDTGRSPSHWHWGYIDTVMHNSGIHLPQLYSGLIVYNKTLNTIVSKHIDYIFNHLKKWDVKSFFKDGYPDEIIYSILFGLEGITVSESLHDFLSNQETCDAMNKIDHLEKIESEFISIGPFCSSVLMIQNASLKKKSYPFDNIFSSLSMIEHCIEDEFNIFLNTIYSIQFDEKISSNHFYEPYLHHDIIIGNYNSHGLNHEYIPVFRHHDLTNIETKKAFVRRCKRFLDVLKEDTTKCFVYTIRYCDKTYEEEINQFSNYIQRWTKNYIIIVIHVIDKPSSVNYSNHIVTYTVPNEEEGTLILKKYTI